MSSGNWEEQIPASGIGGLRILAYARSSFGTDDDALVRAFRRRGCSVTTLDDEYVLFPRWRSRKLWFLRRLLRSSLVRETSEMFLRMADVIEPHLVFVFKGQGVGRSAVERLKARGCIAVLFHPDASFFSHGPVLAAALESYDWVFTTKALNLEFLRTRGVGQVSYLPSFYDPDLHRPTDLTPEDQRRHGCDVCLIANHSPKKEAWVAALAESRPSFRIRVWGSGWGHVKSLPLRRAVTGMPLYGTEAVKAIRAAAINLGLLVERQPGSPSGDLTTARTFQIPASGGFMLHEDNEELRRFLDPEHDCASFVDIEELRDAVDMYLRWPGERHRRADSGRNRILRDGHASDDRVLAILEKVGALREAHQVSRVGGRSLKT